MLFTALPARKADGMAFAESTVEKGGLPFSRAMQMRLRLPVPILRAANQDRRWRCSRPAFTVPARDSAHGTRH